MAGQEGGDGEPQSQPCLLPAGLQAPQCPRQCIWQVKVLLLPNPQILLRGSKEALEDHPIQLPVSAACDASALFIEQR